MNIEIPEEVLDLLGHVYPFERNEQSIKRYLINKIRMDLRDEISMLQGFENIADELFNKWRREYENSIQKN